MFTEIRPQEALKPYVKRFYYYDAPSAHAFDDLVFPSGNLELIFNLGNGLWKTKKDEAFCTTPAVELWGQITRPLAVRSVGKNFMLGVRFHPHTAAYFFDEDISAFNNEITNAVDVFGPSLSNLHELLLTFTDPKDRIAMLENYLLNRLAASEKKHARIQLVEAIANGLKNHAEGERIGMVSERNKISPRYVHRLFSQYTGLTPKLFCQISRFQYSLQLMQGGDQKMTSVGYDSGYFDQSHFIREFKSFTGLTPSSFSTQATPINQILSNI